jgi:phosphatidylinositol alpha-1,6-mannosyltransferase
VRTLIVSPDFPPAQGGIQILTHRLAVGLPDAEVGVVTLGVDGAARFDREQRFPISRIRASPIRQLDIARLNAAIMRAALRHRPDVVVSMHIVTAPAAVALRSLAGVPYVQYTYAKELAARPHLARQALRHADMVVAISSYTESLCVAAGAAPDQVRLIRPGVDPSPTRSPAPARIPGRILTVSRLTDEHKGHDVMTRAMAMVRARCPHAHWVVLGDGALRPSLESLARSLDLDDAITFAGAVTDAERDRALWESEVFAMPSRIPPGQAGEGFGIVYLEAGAAGLPALAGNVGGAVDAVVHGETGLLVDPTDSDEVARGLIRLLEDDALRRRLGEAGARRARELSWDRAAAAVRHVLDEVA